MRTLIGSGLVVLALAIFTARAEPIKVVAAEKVYGDIAEQIGGAHVTVASILTHPNQDPHEFEASAATARAIADARLVIYNGAGYDPWAVKLLSASKSPSREVIDGAAPPEDRHAPDQVRRDTRYRHRARVRLHGGCLGAHDAQRPLSACSDEWYRAECGGDRSLRKGPANARGQG